MIVTAGCVDCNPNVHPTRSASDAESGPVSPSVRELPFIAHEHRRSPPALEDASRMSNPWGPPGVSAHVRRRKDRAPYTTAEGGVNPAVHPDPGGTMLLILAAVLLVIAIAGGVIVHPLLFLIAILAIVVFFMDRRGRVV
jgi:hypothetical protein